MKITIAREFDTPEAAYAFLASVAGLSAEPVVTAAAGEEVTAPSSPTAPSEKPARKPRSDAGQPRGAYKRRGTTTGESPASEPDTTAAVDSATVATVRGEGSPSNSPAPAEAVSAPQAPAASATVAEPAAGEFPATADGARAALQALNQVPGKGMDACLATLRNFGVQRLSDLKQGDYAKFIERVVEQLPVKK